MKERKARTDYLQNLPGDAKGQRTRACHREGAADDLMDMHPHAGSDTSSHPFACGACPKPVPTHVLC
jgi:hypothetical protein